MAFDIFRVDWILVDSIIITILILFLIAARIFKITSRWRASISNESITETRLKDFIDPPNLNYSYFEGCSLLINKNHYINATSRPSVVIIKPYRRRKFWRALAEGLCSSGLNVLILKQNSFRIFKKKLNNENFDAITKEFWRLLNEFTNQLDINLNERSVIINQGKISEAFLPTNLEPEMEALILINPIGLEIHPKYICSQPESTSKTTRLHYLFSKKKPLLTSNTTSKRVLNQKESCNLTDLNVVMLEKAKKSFRNHETVILGIIIDIIKSLNR